MITHPKRILNIKVRNRIALAFGLLFIWLIAGNIHLNAQNSQADSLPDCNFTGTVYDYTGLDGCGFVIELDNGKKLEIAEMVPNVLLRDSMRVRLSYTPLDLASICMVGTIARIDCLEEIPFESCKADFDVYALKCNPIMSSVKCGPDSYQFINKSYGDIVEWHWDFGDGHISDEFSPAHFYTESGEYHVCLKVVASNGCTSMFCRKLTVQFQEPCKAMFEAYPVDQTFDSLSIEDIINELPDPHSALYSFIDQSKGNVINWKWDFGDGSTSTEQNPIHNFQTPGIYEVCLYIATADGCESSYCKTVYVQVPQKCRAMFDYYRIRLNADSIVYDEAGNETDNRLYGYAYQFKDQSLGMISSWHWNFGDGNYSVKQHPIHIYAEPGIYNVTLKIKTYDGCSNSITKIVYAGVSPDCKAEFDYHQIYTLDGFMILDSTEGDFVPVEGFPYQFNDHSRGDVIEWYWDFGDGYTSTEPSPIHNFEYPELFHVCLKIVTSGGCEDMICKEVRVGETPYCQANFTYTFDSLAECANCYPYRFRDQSAGEVESWFWEFGDGNISQEQNPHHTYFKQGIYEVCLTIKTIDGCISTICKKLVVGESPRCKAYFINYPLWMLDDAHQYSETDDVYFPEYAHKFVDQSKGYPVSWHWDFGDGNSSDERDPVHIFEHPGEYEVCLKIETINGCNDMYCTIVKVGYFNECEANFTYCSYHFEDETEISNSFIYHFQDKSTGHVRSWNWSFGDGDISNEQNPIHAYSDTGIFRVCLEIETFEGCHSHLCKSVYVGVTPPICDADFTVDIAFPDCEGFDPIYIFTEQSSGHIYEWYWDLGDGAISWEQHPMHIYEEMGTYTVCLSIKGVGGCADVQCKTITVNADELEKAFMKNCGTTNIEEITNQGTLNVYPNPVDDKVVFELSLESEEQIGITLVDMLGKVVSRMPEKHYLKGTQQIEINIEKLAPGQYYYIMNMKSTIKRGSIQKIK